MGRKKKGGGGGGDVGGGEKAGPQQGAQDQEQRQNQPHGPPQGQAQRQNQPRGPPQGQAQRQNQPQGQAQRQNQPQGPPQGQAQRQNQPHGPPQGQPQRQNQPQGPPQGQAQRQNQPHGPPQGQPQRQNQPHGPPQGQAQRQNQPHGPPQGQPQRQNQPQGQAQRQNQPQEQDQKPPPPVGSPAWLAQQSAQSQSQSRSQGRGRGRGRGQPLERSGAGPQAPGQLQTQPLERSGAGLQAPGQLQAQPQQQFPGKASFVSQQKPLSVEGAPQQVKPPMQVSAPSSAGASEAQRGPPKSAPGFQIPKRLDCPDVVKDGAPIQLEVNHLLLKMNEPNLQIFHYDVSIDPDKPKRFMRPVMRRVQQEFYPTSFPGFDGRKNLYSKGILPNIESERTVEIQVVDEERQDKAPKPFKVTLKLVRTTLSLQELFAYQQSGKSTNPPQDTIQALDVILRSAASQNFVQVGRSFFCQPERPKDLGTGMELWLGFFQSFIMGRRPYLNIDVAHKGFPKPQNLLNLLKDLDPRARSAEDVLRYKRDIFEKFVRGLKIQYEIPGIESSKRVYRVNGLRDSAIRERFQLKDKETITIGEYFQKEKRYNIKYPALPCLHIGPREKEIIVPLELCSIVPGQAVQKKLDETQTANMVRAAATSVEDRKQKIKEAMRKANLNASSECREFGLSIANEFANVNGRILPAPKLKYNRGYIAQPMKGVWRGGAFLQSRHLKKWICVLTTMVPRDDLQSFCYNLRKEASQLDMEMDEPHPPIELNARDFRGFKGELTRVLQDLQSKQYDLVLVVISGFNKQVYGQVKQLAEIQVGILTQCVKDKTVTTRNNQATVHNIMLKINAKFNGINQVICESPKMQCLKNKVLVFGADVTHPSPDSKDIPSVAAVTASHDLGGFKYNMQIRLQPPRQEIIGDLSNIVYEQLNVYRQEVGHHTEHILFYRDGVSEGQFQQVLDLELRAIFDACSKLHIRPKVTFLVVQKRHHTRFFPKDRRQSHDKNGNVPAGTIVDTEITHPTEIDFYLVSHASIQGVARPTKYHVLWDDANMSENEIHLLTYSLCHLFTRCDRAVSYPAPTYYAHLAASRGRVYLEGHNLTLDNLAKESAKIQTALNFKKTSPMYFV